MANHIYGFDKNEGQKDLRSMKRGVNWLENQGQNLYKMGLLNNTFWWNILDQLYLQVSLELNVKETNWFFLQKVVNMCWMYILRSVSWWCDSWSCGSTEATVWYLGWCCQYCQPHGQQWYDWAHSSKYSLHSFSTQ